MRHEGAGMRGVVRAWLAAFCLVFVAGELGARQDGLPATLVNGDLESVDAEGKPAGWRLSPALSAAGYVTGTSTEDVVAGERSAFLDSRTATPGPNQFGNLSQSFDASAWRGKRVRFRAAVRLGEHEDEARAQLWLRVDRPAVGTAVRMGFFDNMGDRPITAGEWQHHEIVGDVASDAKTVVLGLLTFGRGLVRIDDVSFEAVGVEVAATGGNDAQDLAPRQPFWTPWLALPLAALALFALAFLARGWPAKVGLAFAFAYWGLYACSTLLSYLVPFFGAGWSRAFERGPVDGLVRWAARAWFGLHEELVGALENGSGDTTFAYVQAFLTFVLALALALVVGTLWARRAPIGSEHPRARDVLRSVLRVYLAIYMVSYGLAKLGTLTNQFSAPGLWRLTETYGESSPMGLLWTFMGSSRAYTYFAGGSELLGGFLLLFRRTALLGALVSFGVMLNVMLMNFCFDVPVKLFSTHLVVAAGLIALPQLGRLGELFVGFRCVRAPELTSPFRGSRGLWLQCGLKVYLVVLVAFLPLYQLWISERESAPYRPTLGEWRLATLELDGARLAPPPTEVEYLTLVPRPTPDEEGFRFPCQVALAGGSSLSASAVVTPEHLTLGSTSPTTSRLFSAALRWRREGELLHLESPGVHATFRPADQDFLLMRRGFRWINEYPYNR